MEDKVYDRVYEVNTSSVKLDPLKVVSFDKGSRRFSKDQKGDLVVCKDQSHLGGPPEVK